MEFSSGPTGEDTLDSSRPWTGGPVVTKQLAEPFVGSGDGVVISSSP